MKETGITMSGDHPAKILDGTKTMTRRVVIPQPHIHTVASGITHCNWQRKPSETLLVSSYPYLEAVLNELVQYCPYGQVGDRLWVRETWFTWKKYDRLKPSEIPDTAPMGFLATDKKIKFDWAGTTRPSRFLPRWASRILLEITDIRVERLQEITFEDCKAEGIDIDRTDAINIADKFVRLWDSLNAKRGYGWEVNPWVWVVLFKLLEQKHGEGFVA